MSEITITNMADNKKTGMTLVELENFVLKCHTMGIRAEAQLRVEVGWRGQLQKIQVR